MRFRRAFRKEILTASEIERRLYGAPLTEMNKHTPPPSGGALEAKEILNNLLHRKETVMPDIQTALKSAIDAWEPTPTGQQLKEKLMQNRPVFEVQNNVTRVTFDYIKLHPGTTSAAASRDLVKHGFKESSVTALMAQFVRAGLAVRDNNHGYRVTVDEYTPMKAAQKYAKKVKAPTKVKPATTNDHKRPLTTTSQNDGIAALQPEATSKRVVNTIVFGKPPEEVVKHMNVIQARELYDYLKKMFGG
jgi:alpha-L-arabinofuranosidase